ncbi:MAG: hypothetical protein LH654_05205 [Thermoleophilia bacterium]|nr:hypothetical protein [Thermoleophilia bacterium]
MEGVVNLVERGGHDEDLVAVAEWFEAHAEARVSADRRDGERIVSLHRCSCTFGRKDRLRQWRLAGAGSDRGRADNPTGIDRADVDAGVRLAERVESAGAGPPTPERALDRLRARRHRAVNAIDEE